MSVFKDVSVAIIGTAGRGLEATDWNADSFGKMCVKAASIILDEWKLDPTNLTLVSGGSAWSDHVAVELFLNDTRFRQSKLVLYLPCQYKNKQFADERSWHRCGQLLNELHGTFGTKLARSTLEDLHKAKERGATLDTSSRGFFARNLRVGTADYMIAFSTASGNRPNDGGTAHTWRNATTPPHRRSHVSLTSILTPTAVTTHKPSSPRRRKPKSDETKQSVSLPQMFADKKSNTYAKVAKK